MIYGYRDRVRSMVVSMLEHDIRYINSDFFSRDILTTVNVSPCITKTNIIYICIIIEIILFIFNCCYYDFINPDFML